MSLRLALKATQEEAGEQCLAYAAKITATRHLRRFTAPWIARDSP